MLATGTLIVGISVFTKLALPETPCFVFYWIYYIGYLIWVYSFIVRCIKIQYLFKWNITKLKKSGNWKVNLFKSQKEIKTKNDTENKKHSTSFYNNYVYSSSRFQRSLKLPTNRFNTSFLLFLLLVFILLLIILLSIPQFMSESFAFDRNNCFFGGIMDYIFMFLKIIFYIIVCPMFFFVILEVNESFGVKHILFVTILLGIPCQLFEYIPQLRLNDTYANEYSNSQIYYCILDVVIMFAVHVIDVVKPISEEYNISISFSRFLLNFVQLKKHSNDQSAHSDSGFDTFERVMNIPQLFKTFKYFCVTDYAIVDIIFFERWRDIREQVLLYNYYKKKALDGPSSSKSKYAPPIYNIDSTLNSKGLSSSNTITQPRMRNFSNMEPVNISVHSDYTYINNNTASTSQTSQESSAFSDNFQPTYYFDDNKTPLNKMPDILIPPCLLPLFIGLYQTFINSGSIFELNDIPIDKLEKLSNQIMYSPLYYHFLSNVSNNKNSESNENLINNIEEIDEDEDNNYNLDRYTKHAQLIYSQASSYETINSMSSNRQDHSYDLKSYTSSTSTKVISYSHSGYSILPSGSNNLTSTITNTITNNSVSNTNISNTSGRNRPGQPRCLFNYEDMNFEENEAMSLEINLSCTIFDEILDIIYHRMYEYSYRRFISDTKNRKLVHNILKSMHKQKKRRKNVRSNSRSGTLRNTPSQSTSNNASYSQTKESTSSKYHHNKTSSTSSYMKFSENSKSHSKNGHHHNYTQSYSSGNNNHNNYSNNNNNNNNNINFNDHDIDNSNNEYNNTINNNLKNNNEDTNFDSDSTEKLFVVGCGSMNEKQINNQATYEVISKDKKIVNTMNKIQSDKVGLTSINDQENCFNTYPLNSTSNKGKGPFDTINNGYYQLSDNNQINTDNILQNSNYNNKYNNISSFSKNNSINGNDNDKNNSNFHINSKNSLNKNKNENYMKSLTTMNGQEHHPIIENDHYSYHDDLSVFWESEEENEENISINESLSEEELMTPQLHERSSDLFRKNMESFRQKLLGSSGRDRQNSTNSTSSTTNNGNNAYFSNIVTSVKRKSSNISNLIFNHQNRDNNNAIELKSLDNYDLS
ncbi:hypothetical protein BCR36DRAFT_364918 [Piromyces finnis]|uniref:RGS domain-containing protein n=1 Tax=Piromyces finnis TaxID=1754191 RepID=A0A1Y1UPM6_9FUNG|nr:hypothetical protein BCR36DRAFT_364918 [Piromyces finnis]|eukprot:ORX39464.1 hypothetical protein BCR36DRAFT_364918 [Piromyces finnis]